MEVVQEAAGIDNIKKSTEKYEEAFDELENLIALMLEELTKKTVPKHGDLALQDQSEQDVARANEEKELTIRQRAAELAKKWEEINLEPGEKDELIKRLLGIIEYMQEKIKANKISKDEEEMIISGIASRLSRLRKVVMTCSERTERKLVEQFLVLQQCQMVVDKLVKMIKDMDKRWREQETNLFNNCIAMVKKVMNELKEENGASTKLSANDCQMILEECIHTMDEHVKNIKEIVESRECSNEGFLVDTRAPNSPSLLLQKFSQHKMELLVEIKKEIAKGKDAGEIFHDFMSKIVPSSENSASQGIKRVEEHIYSEKEPLLQEFLRKIEHLKHENDSGITKKACLDKLIILLDDFVAYHDKQMQKGKESVPHSLQLQDYKDELSHAAKHLQDLVSQVQGELAEQGHTHHEANGKKDSPQQETSDSPDNDDESHMGKHALTSFKSQDGRVFFDQDLSHGQVLNKPFDGMKGDFSQGGKEEGSISPFVCPCMGTKYVCESSSEHISCCPKQIISIIKDTIKSQNLPKESLESSDFQSTDGIGETFSGLIVPKIPKNIESIDTSGRTSETFVDAIGSTTQNLISSSNQGNHDFLGVSPYETSKDSRETDSEASYKSTTPNAARSNINENLASSGDVSRATISYANTHINIENHSLTSFAQEANILGNKNNVAVDDDQFITTPNATNVGSTYKNSIPGISSDVKAAAKKEDERKDSSSEIGIMPTLDYNQKSGIIQNNKDGAYATDTSDICEMKEELYNNVLQNQSTKGDIAGKDILGSKANVFGEADIELARTKIRRHDDLQQDPSILSVKDGEEVETLTKFVNTTPTLLGPSTSSTPQNAWIMVHHQEQGNHTGNLHNWTQNPLTSRHSVHEESRSLQGRMEDNFTNHLGGLDKTVSNVSSIVHNTLPNQEFDTDLSESESRSSRVLVGSSGFVEEILTTVSDMVTGMTAQSGNLDGVGFESETQHPQEGIPIYDELERASSGMRRRPINNGLGVHSSPNSRTSQNIRQNLDLLEQLRWHTIHHGEFPNERGQYFPRQEFLRRSTSSFFQPYQGRGFVLRWRYWLLKIMEVLAIFASCYLLWHILKNSNSSLPHYMILGLSKDDESYDQVRFKRPQELNPHTVTDWTPSAIQDIMHWRIFGSQVKDSDKFENFKSKEWMPDWQERSQMLKDKAQKFFRMKTREHLDAQKTLNKDNFTLVDKDSNSWNDLVNSLEGAIQQANNWKADQLKAIEVQLHNWNNNNGGDWIDATHHLEVKDRVQEEQHGGFSEYFRTSLDKLHSAYKEDKIDCMIPCKKNDDIFSLFLQYFHRGKKELHTTCSEEEQDYALPNYGYASESLNQFESTSSFYEPLVAIAKEAYHWAIEMTHLLIFFIIDVFNMLYNLVSYLLG